MKPVIQPKSGDQALFCEPSWYQGFPTPYYVKKSHVELRDKIRAFCEKEITPYMDDWIKNKQLYPKDLHIKAYKAGFSGILYPEEYGGTPIPDGFDAFHEVILWDELCRVGAGEALGQLAINSMALPPIIKHGSKYLKDLVVKDVVQGRKFISLMISEPTHGSDVIGIQTTAVRQGDFYIVNGLKKWITGGLFADYFMCVARTGGPGAGGISLLLIDRHAPGVTVRKMETMFDSCHGTTFITMEDVKVPVANLIGQENQGLKLVMVNFNHERFVLAAQACRFSRLCYSMSLHESSTRYTFGKKLYEHQMIRYKLAEMARQVESLQAMVDSTAFLFAQRVPDDDLGAHCAMLKVHSTKVFEYCAREAVQIFGGSGIVKEGRGMQVERLYRDVRQKAIPGGSEEILIDMTARQAIKKSGL